jgi:hypothetical protein
MRLLLKSVLELSPDKKQCLETAVVLAAVLLLFSLLDAGPLYGWVSFGVLVAGLIIPGLFYPLAKLWFGLALILGWFSSRILLSLLFFLLVTPVGLIRRMMGKDKLMLRQFKKDHASVMISRNHRFTAEDLKPPF